MNLLETTTIVPLSIADWMFTEAGLGVAVVFLSALMHGIDTYERGKQAARVYKYAGAIGGVLIAINIVVPRIGGETPTNIVSSVVFGFLVVAVTSKVMEYTVPLVVRSMVALGSAVKSITTSDDIEPQVGQAMDENR